MTNDLMLLKYVVLRLQREYFILCIFSVVIETCIIFTEQVEKIMAIMLLATSKLKGKDRCVFYNVKYALNIKFDQKIILFH